MTGAAAPVVRPLASRLVRAGVWLGLSLAGFFDGIVLHQLLQWHHMLTNVGDATVREDVALNTLADGLFHVAAYLFAAVALVLLWKARHDVATQAGPAGLLGAVLLGAGLFNLVEGVVNHHLLGIHHVNQTVPREAWIYWDLGFLAWGAMMALGGWWLVRRARQTA
jgi:uncharacterized membrane protein